MEKHLSDFRVDEYQDIKLTTEEASLSVKAFKAKLNKLRLTTEETSQAIMEAKKKKYFKIKEQAYWKKVWQLHPQNAQL